MTETFARYKRVLLKVSGEALMGDGSFGIEPQVSRRLPTMLRPSHATVCRSAL